MKNCKSEIVELSLEKVEKKEGKFFFTSVSLTKDFECEEALNILAKRNVNKDLVWRHRHPLQNPINDIFGRVNNSWVKEGILSSEYEVYDYDQDHLDFIDLVKSRIEVGDPLGVSMHYRKYYDKNDKVKHYDVFEHSGTPFPACEDCKNLDYKVVDMANEKPDQNEEELLKQKLEKIKELEDSLNTKTKAFEELKSRIEILEEDIKKKDEILEEKEEKEKTWQDAILEMNKEINYLKKKPLIDEMMEYRDLDGDEIEFYNAKDEDYLIEKKEQFKSESENKVQVKTQEESAKDSADAIREKAKKEDLSYEVDGKKLTGEELFDYATKYLGFKRGNE